MSENQPEKRTRGRPLDEASFVLPDKFREDLHNSGFFDLAADRTERLKQLVKADDVDRKYRVRAAVLFALTRIDTHGVELALGRSWKQIRRYLAGGKLPAAALEGLAVAAEVPSSWLTSGSTEIARLLASSWEKEHVDREVPLKVGNMPRKSGNAPKEHGNQQLEANLQVVAAGGELVEGSRAEVSRRLGEVVELFKTKREAAKAARRSEDTLSSYLGGKSVPFEVVGALCEAKGVSLDWIWTGEGPMRGGIVQPGLPVDGFVYIPRYGDVRASAGTGQLVSSEAISDFLAFREDWVRFRLRRNPLNLVVIEAVGDSMAPTIENGDIMLMDKSETRIRDSAIYVLASGDEAIVKRVERKFDGALKIISDNPVYETQTLSADQAPDLRVLGRIVWAGGLV